jgi:very-short-patch-repair endonuclease
VDRQIIYYYQRGVASYLIAKKFGVSNTYVRKLLDKNGIKLRGHNVTNKMSAQRRTPEENREITKKASEANVGKVHVASHRVKLALARERNPKIDPVYEQPLVDLCRKSGVSVIPQKAFDKFNVDLYLPKENVVIEIFGGGFHNKKQAVELFNNKISYLSRKKIPVLIVWADKLTYDVKSVLDIAQKTKKLTIITGDGKPTSRGSEDIKLLQQVKPQDGTHNDS